MRAFPTNQFVTSSHIYGGCRKVCPQENVSRLEDIFPRKFCPGDPFS